MFTESELEMWNDDKQETPQKFMDHEIDAKYERGEQRIVTESNREKLPNFVKALEQHEYMDLRPFYQRRKRWDERKQSKLIESFIMNIPVPPIFLYEKEFNKYEVMDGQQRITAIREFYKNNLTLKGLESWPELNGKDYHSLPPKVRAGVDRRSLSSIVLLKESAPDEESDWLLKRMVFERLNTGGEKLTRQEVRNCLYSGQLNKLLLKLSKNPVFREVWGIPNVPVPDGTEPPDALAENTDYKKMRDCEFILRFFALRHFEHFTGAMQDFLDRYMIRSMKFHDEEFDFLAQLFRDTMSLCADLYDEYTFHPFDTIHDDWSNGTSVSFADAVMVGIGNHVDKREELLNKKSQVILETKALFKKHHPKAFTGSANTKTDVQERIRLYSAMISEVLES